MTDEETILRAEGNKLLVLQILSLDGEIEWEVERCIDLISAEMLKMNVENPIRSLMRDIEGENDENEV